MCITIPETGKRTDAAPNHRSDTERRNPMSKETYKTVSIIAGIVAVIGLVSLLGGIRAVNLGAVIIPALISAGSYAAWRKK